MVSVPPVLDSAWVSAVGAVVAVGVAEHDVPSAVRVVAVDTRRWMIGCINVSL